MDRLISVNDARRGGVTKLRLDHWANPADHIEIYLTDARELGPWVKLWSPTNEAIGEKNPQQFLITMLGDLDAKSWRQYAEH